MHVHQVWEKTASVVSENLLLLFSFKNGKNFLLDYDGVKR